MSDVPMTATEILSLREQHRICGHEKLYIYDAVGKPHQVECPWCLAAELAACKAERDHHGKPCDFCGKPIDNFAGNPGKWSLSFPRPDGSGISRAHHVDCVMQQLAELAALKRTKEQLQDELNAALAAIERLTLQVINK